MMCKQVSVVVIAAALLGITPILDAQQPPAAAGGSQDAVAALKQSLQQGQALIKKYEWVETTIVSMKGEEKSRKQNRCYYGADGKVQKVALGEPAAPQPSSGGGGRRGGRIKEKAIENKKDEMQDYMERAVKLVHTYVPPNPSQIQSAKDAGRISVHEQAGGRVQLEIAQYLQPGDKLAIDLDAGAKRLLGLGVDTYLGTPEDPVTLAVQMGALPDGASYVAQTTLDAKAKNIRVVIQNSGHRPVSQ
jgi:hypothetical protein